MEPKILKYPTEAKSWAYANGLVSRPHYPLPAKKVRTFEYWRNLGYVSALNSFDIEVIQSLNRYR